MIIKFSESKNKQLELNLLVALKDQLSRLLQGFEEKLHGIAKLILRIFYLRDME